MFLTTTEIRVQDQETDDVAEEFTYGRIGGVMQYRGAR